MRRPYRLSLPPGLRPPGRRTALRLLSTTVATAIALSLVGAQGVSAAAAQSLKAQAVPSVPSVKVRPKARPSDLTQGAGRAAYKSPVWPAAGSAEAALTLVDKGRPAGTTAQAGTLPVRVAGAGFTKAGVTIVDRTKVPAAWKDGVVLRVGRADGGTRAAKATVSVDYSGFATAYGADWASRLRLAVLPECALTTPGAPGCSAQPIPSHNDTRTKLVTAEVALPGAGSTAGSAAGSAAAGKAAQASGGVLMAVEAGASGSAGDYAATSMQASGTWTAGGNSGDFSWTYPLRTPPSLGGPAPQISLAYSSSSMDGKGEATNNQPSWIGDGFDYTPGFIERRYTPCGEDQGTGNNNSTKTGDLCWVTDNANMSMSGRGGELIKDDGTGAWKLKNDDGTRIERFTNTVNGDNDNEYWKVTTPDGMQYFFGLNRLPGYTGTAPANRVTSSVWTEPVAGNHAGEPCHASAFTSSFCTQAWRWNLDYVVDTHGNTMSYYYTAETNKYARNNTDSDAVSYVRGGWLDHIEYGTDKRSGTDTANTATKAPMVVQFGVQDRCLSGCTTHDQAHWSDVPWDQECTGSSCAGKYAPTFWTTKRLATVTTRVWDTAAAAYKDVDLWTLTHTYPDPGDGTRAGMWLESIVHSGRASGPAVVGSAIDLPEVNFDWIQLTNRVDTTTDGKPAMNWMRMGTIWSESGSKLSIRYTAPECVAGSHMPASPQANTMRCYPVLEEQPDKSIKTEYFHKYLVDTVTQADLTGGGPDVVTSYTYGGTPAWRHTDDDGITKDNLRTWSDFRGYDRVETRVGDPGSGVQTLSVSTYFRGMNGDLDGAGGTRTVSIPAADLNGDGDTTDAADAPAVTDENAFSGMIRQTTLGNGVESAPINTTVNQPWQSPPTATRNMGATTAYARHTTTQTGWSAVKLSAGGWRVTKSTSTFDSYGQPVTVDDSGDLGVTGDERCVRTTYVPNTSANILGAVSQTEEYSKPCGTAPAAEADVISLTRTAFDHQAFGAAPSKGEITQADKAKSWTPAGGPSWVTQSASTSDAYGRVIDYVDVRGNHTTTAYTPSGTAPVTQTVTTGTLGTTTATIEPAWGYTTATVDVNGKREDKTYDPLGQVTQIWLANHLKAGFPGQPNTKYAYAMRNAGGPSAVTTQKLNAAGNYVTSYVLFDGFLRTRQSQGMSMANGNVGTVFQETKYDALNRPVNQSTYFDAAVQPSATLRTILDWQPKTQTITEYDRAGRVTASITRSAGAELWRTTTTYGGDRVSVLPPNGGVAETSIMDARGRITELRQYNDRAALGGDVRSTYDLVAYHFDARGNVDSLTDNAGNTWTNTFDLLGRKVASHDPDKGDSTAVVNDYGDVVSSTDARGRVLAFTYDAMGRKTGEYADSTAGAKLATWAWDPAGAKGHLASSSRWVNGTDEYKVKVRGYTPLYQSTGEDYVIPAVASMTGLSGTYSITRSYKVDGSAATLSYPNVGGLGAETITYTYDPVSGQPEQLQTNVPGFGQYVSNTDYTAFGEISFVQYGLTAGNWLQRSFTYDDATRRITRAQTVRQLSPQAVDDATYAYDQAGNITGIADTPASGGVDNQCFAYDYAKRLTDAWTPTSGDCSQAKSATQLSGPAPYWQSWTFTAAGDRKTETTHTAAGDTTATYTYGAAGGVRPHSVLSVRTQGPGVDRTDSYAYDETGNTTGRPGATANQILTWDTEGHLAKDSENGKDSTYLYNADGARLVGNDGTATTIYLPSTEIKRNNTTGVVTANRYYTWSGQVCAMAGTGTGVTWLVADHQGSQKLTVAAGNQAITVRWQNPYGEARGTDPAWANTKGFVGGDKDATGLTHLGAREYDPNIGRFISVDQVFDSKNPQSWNGYAYADNTPVTGSDPSGLMFLADGGGDGYVSGGGGGGGYSDDPVGPAGGIRKKPTSGRPFIGPVIPKYNPWDPYQQARKAYFDDDFLKDGQVRQRWQGPKTDRDEGIVIIRMFISEAEVGPPGLKLHGDDRDFSTDPNAGYRYTVAWDTKTGEVTLTLNPSCDDKGCTPARDIGGGNNIKFTFDDNEIAFDYSVKESRTKGAMDKFAPSVDGHMSLKFDKYSPNHGFDMRGEADFFPSIEVNQYFENNSCGTRVMGRSKEDASGFLSALAPLPNRYINWSSHNDPPSIRPAE